MRRKFAQSIAAVCCLTVLFSQINAPLLQAATNTWNGNSVTTDDWTDSTNWTGGVPTNDSTADVIFGGTNRLTSNVDTNNPWKINALTFNSTAGAFAIHGNQLQIDGGGITNNSTNVLETINNNISVNATQSFTASSGDLQFGGTVTLNSALTVTGAKNTEFAAGSVLTSGGGLIKDGAGNLTISGSTTGFTGDVTIGGTGTVTRTGAGVLPGNINYTINSGILDLNGQDLTMKRLEGTGGEVKLTSANLTIDTTSNVGYGGVISGSGGFIKKGTGTQELNGANTYTGGTTVLGGVLKGTAGVGLRGNITDNANVTFNQTSGTGTYADIVSGTGSVTKINAGTVILSGANSYMGGTSVGGGTLQGDTTSLQGNIDTAANTKVSFTQNTDGTYAGTLSGGGSLVKAGTGTVILSADNTYTGGTTINAGTLQLGNGGTTGSVPGDVTDNGTLAFNRSDPVVYANVVSGTGGIHQEGAGKLTLTGANTFNGASTVDAGTTLQVGNAGTTGTLGNGGTVRDNGLLIFDRTDNITANNNISGSGIVQQLSSATLILSGNNSYTGGTSVTNGTLQGTNLSIQGNVTTASGTTVIFDQSTDGSTNAAITGGASLVKNGTGTVELTGVSSYAGATSVNAGALFVNGSVTSSNVLVDVNGTLGGTGTIAGNIDNNGTMSPGSLASPTGTLSVTGNYHQETGSTFKVLIDGNASNKLTVSGTATLDAPSTFNVDTPNTANAGIKVAIIQAGNIVHSDPADYTVTDNLVGLLEATLSFSDDDTMAFISILRNGETYAAVGNTFNEKAVGRYLDRISPTASGDLQTVFDTLNSIDDPELRVAESQMAGALHGTLGQIGVQNTTLIVGQIAQRLRSSSMAPMPDPCCCQCGGCHPDICSGCLEGSLFAPVCPCGGSDWTGWAQGFGLGGNAKTDGNAPGADYGMGGVVAGVERWMDDSRILGFYGGYTGSTVATNAPNSTINGGNLGGYLYADDGFNYWTIMNGYEFDSYNTHRLLQFGDIDREASANYNGWQAYVYAERGVSYESCGRLLQPFVGLQYLYLRQNSFTEHGADSIDLAANGVNTNSLRSLLGARMQWAWMHRTCRRSFPEIHAYWLHEYIDSHSLVDATFSPTPEGGGTPFIAHGLDLGRDWAVAGASFTWEMHGGWSMFVNGDVQTNNQATLYIGSGGLGHLW